MMKFTYDFLEINDKAPMIEFLDSLSIRDSAKIFASIDKLVELKNSNIQPKENLSKHVEDNIFELRVRLTDNIARCLYFYVINQKIIFTHGFIKKTQKLPRKEIELAKELRKKYGDL
jgi:phage-related protein